MKKPIEGKIKKIFSLIFKKRISSLTLIGLAKKNGIV